jgi:hypothetical protein
LVDFVDQNAVDMVNLHQVFVALGIGLASANAWRQKAFWRFLEDKRQIF